METPPNVIFAVSKRARKLENLEASVFNDFGYYQSTREELENGNRLTDEQLLSGAYIT